MGFGHAKAARGRRWLPRLAVHPETQLLAGCNADGGLGLWTLPDLEPAPRGPEVQGRTFCGTFTADGQSLATGGAFRDGIQLWRIDDRSVMGFPSQSQYGPRSLAFTPDGCRLVSTYDDGTTRVWDVASRTTLKVLPPAHRRSWGTAVAGWQHVRHRLRRRCRGLARLRCNHGGVSQDWGGCRLVPPSTPWPWTPPALAWPSLLMIGPPSPSLTRGCTRGLAQCLTPTRRPYTPSRSRRRAVRSGSAMGSEPSDKSMSRPTPASARIRSIRIMWINCPFHRKAASWPLRLPIEPSRSGRWPPAEC